MKVLRPIIALLALLVCASLCRTVPNRNPVGEAFPRVEGSRLSEQTSLRIPQDLQPEGQPIVLLIGYVMEAQFDIDRWLIGLVQSEAPVDFYEIPTIDGMVPGLFAGSIDSGMRSGIPDEDESLVITVYEDAGQIVEFTGEERPRNARVLLLDGEGRVRWFHDEGFSARKLQELLIALRETR